MQTSAQKALAERYALNQTLGTLTFNDAATESIPKPVITQLRAEPPSCNQGPFHLRSLPSAEIRLSNQPIQSTAKILSVMGYTVVSPSNPGETQANSYSCAQLPIVVLPFVRPEDQLTFDEAGYRNDGSGQVAGLLPLRMGSSEDLDRMLVFYHPQQRDRLDLLRSTVELDIDRPSPQVFLETLVVEVNKEDSKELGLDLQSANVSRQSVLSVGQLVPGLGSSVDFLRNTLRTDGVSELNPGQGVRFRLRALVESGRAQILSRPSILALSNRQAVIQIVDVVQTPNLSSRADINGNFTVSDYSFEPQLIGITLSLRPRVSADRQWVSMEIDATVDAEVDENSGEVFATDGSGERVLLATKPGTSSRKVRTFARIPDRTPIVIGGLAAANQEKIKSRVPFLGRLPFLGAFFGATDNEVQEREIIIVLTPYVLDEDNTGVGANAYLGNPGRSAQKAPMKQRSVATPAASDVTLPQSGFSYNEPSPSNADSSPNSYSNDPSPYSDPYAPSMNSGSYPGDGMP
ncbi:MAG: type II secretion system protein GspD [Oceanococcus sp.]